MRLTLIAVATGLLAACASTPTTKPVSSAPTVAVAPHFGSDLIGMSAADLGQRLGQPRLQVREGDTSKVQYVAGSCVLDAYLSASGGGVARVTHVDTRTSDGRSVGQSGCIASIEAR